MYILIFGHLIDEIQDFITKYFIKLEKYSSHILIFNKELTINLDFLNILYPKYPKFIIYIYEDGTYNKTKFIQDELLVDAISDIFPIYKINALDSKQYIIDCIIDILTKHKL